MSSQTRRRPDYQMVDGFCLAGAICPKAFRDTVNFKVRPTDVFVCTFPKSGTTWTQQCLGLLRHQGRPPKNRMQFIRECPFLEFTGTEHVDLFPDPRFAKIHLPFQISPYHPDAKYIFVVRNPKDVLVSFYHHTKTDFYDYADGDFKEYFEIFMNGGNDFGDYFDHVLSWYEHRNDPNVLMIYYESMKKDLASEIRRIATFLGPQYLDVVNNEEQMAGVLKYSGFEYMKTRQDLGDDSIEEETRVLPRGMQHIFKYLEIRDLGKLTVDDVKLVRKGIVGGWRANFSEEQNRRMNEKIELKLKGTEMLDYWKSIDCL